MGESALGEIDRLGVERFSPANWSLEIGLDEAWVNHSDVIDSGIRKGGRVIGFLIHWSRVEGGWQARILTRVGARTWHYPVEDQEQARRLAEAWMVSEIDLYDQCGVALPRISDLIPSCLPKGENWETLTPDLRIYWAYLLRELRRGRGWKQADAAAALGMQQSFYCRLEDPKTANPTLSTIERICRGYGLRLSLNP